MPVQEASSRLYSTHTNGHPPSPNSKPHLHAVVVPWPGQGHINPLLHLSKRLASEFGFSITFVNIDFTHRLIQTSLQAQKDAAAEEKAPDALEIQFVGLPDGVPAEATRTGSVPDLCRGVLYSAPAFEQLVSEIQPRPTCIISDIFVEHTQDVANKLGIPRVAFWTQSAASFAAHVVASRGLLPDCYDEENSITNVAGAPPLRFEDLPGFLQTYAEPDFMFTFSTAPFTRLEEAQCVLMNCFEAMEEEAMDALRQEAPECKFLPIGPVLPVDYFRGTTFGTNTLSKTLGFWVEDYSCLKWLDSQQEGSVLYISFGSIAEFSEKELHEFALGLEATCFPILWVLRPGVLEGGGTASLPEGFIERTKARIFIIDWAPQLNVLAHSSVCAFFTHGGWNSTLEGVSQGKPLLGFPYFADQMLNCRCIEDFWHNGLALERHGETQLTRHLVESKCRALMNDPKLRKTALALRDGARKAILSGGKGSSTTNLINFVREVSTISKP